MSALLPRASAGGVIVNSEGKLLLVNQHNNSWSFPKGGLEEGESELDAAKREIWEEAGIRDPEYIDLLGVYERYSIAEDGVSEDESQGLRKRTLFLFRTAETPRPDNVETTDARFVTMDEALKMLTHPKDKAFLESVRAKIEAFTA